MMIKLAREITEARKKLVTSMFFNTTFIFMCWMNMVVLVDPLRRLGSHERYFYRIKILQESYGHEAFIRRATVFATLLAGPALWLTGNV